jgi:CRISPR/Cas system Type II protein with McrA/HNH and RuvC-like nuclease domain
MSEIDKPQDKKAYVINMDRVFQNPDGSIYFIRTELTRHYNTFTRDYELAKETGTSHITPEELKFSKSISTVIFLQKAIASEETLENTVVTFQMLLTATIEPTKENRFIYLTKTKNGRIHTKDFQSGVTSAVDMNSPIVTRGRVKKVASNTILPMDAKVYTIVDGELRLMLREPLD